MPVRQLERKYRYHLAQHRCSIHRPQQRYFSYEADLMAPTIAQVPQRLINVHSLALEVCDPQALPEYAILSHTWGTEELSFQTWNTPDHSKPLVGYQKITGACKVAREKFYLDYLWADTCCIDKSSSAELTEAINAMYQYYKNAHVCLIYLADVVHDQSVNADYTTDSAMDTLCSSRWFSRGWTLQELIAPSNVHFYDTDWRPLVGLHEAPFVADAIAERTGIPQAVLTGHSSPSDWCIAARMSWAARRTTTRLEDQAYCLLGIFDVSLPLIYGEGKRAFLRLQEEIIRRSTDQSIFAWTEPPGTARRLELFAESPRDFGYAIVDPVVATHPSRSDVNRLEESFEVSNLGLRITLPLVQCKTRSSAYHAVLNCSFDDDDSGLLAINVIRPYESQEPAEAGSRPERPTVLVPDHSREPDMDCPVHHYSRLAFVPAACVRQAMKESVTIVRALTSNFVASRPGIHKSPSISGRPRYRLTLTLKLANADHPWRSLPTRAAAFPNEAAFLTSEISLFDRLYRVRMENTIQAISFSGISDSGSDVAFVLMKADANQPVLQIGRPNFRLAVMDLNGSDLCRVCEDLRPRLDPASIILRSYRRERLYALPGTQLRLMVNTRSSANIDDMTVTVTVERLFSELKLSTEPFGVPQMCLPGILEGGPDSAGTLEVSTLSLDRSASFQDPEGPVIEEVD